MSASVSASLTQALPILPSIQRLGALGCLRCLLGPRSLRVNKNVKCTYQIEKYHDVCFQESVSFLYQCPDKYAQFQCGDEVDGKLTEMIG